MKISSYLQETSDYLFNHVKSINDSKLFAGLVILLLNISSKFISLPLSKTAEAYVKNHFSRYILVFAVTWMGTRDILTAIFWTILFCFLMEGLWNEKSIFCCFSEGFISNELNFSNAMESPSHALSKDEYENLMKAFEKAQMILKQSVAN